MKLRKVATAGSLCLVGLLWQGSQNSGIATSATPQTTQSVETAPLRATLHQSLDRGEAFVRMLVDYGAKVNLKDATGRTPLDIALGVAPSAPAAPPAGPAGRGARGGPPGAAVPAAALVIDAATIAYLRGLSPSSSAGR